MKNEHVDRLLNNFLEEHSATKIIQSLLLATGGAFIIFVLSFNTLSIPDINYLQVEKIEKGDE